MADADDSYALDDLGGFLGELRGGADLVMGNRFQGGSSPGAMPFLHRYVGNPVLSMLGRLFFHIPVGDFHCGIRAFRRDRMLELGLRHVRHGVRQRDGGPGVAGASCASARCRRCCGPTAARGPRTCAPGATAGGTCVSCSRSARAGSCSTRRLAFQAVGLAGLAWLLVGPRSVGRVVFDVHTHARLRHDVRTRRAGARAGGDRAVVRGAPRAAGAVAAAAPGARADVARTRAGARRAVPARRRRMFRGGADDMGRGRVRAARRRASLRLPIVGSVLAVTGSSIITVSFTLSLTQIGDR